MTDTPQLTDAVEDDSVHRLVLPLLTGKQAAVMEFLKEFHGGEDRLPSSYELQEFLGSSSQNAAMNYFRVLCQKGYLEHRTNQSNARGWYRFSRQNDKISQP
jgi:SOS-response transcriptional repressor LexA